MTDKRYTIALEHCGYTPVRIVSIVATERRLSLIVASGHGARRLWRDPPIGVRRAPDITFTYQLDGAHGDMWLVTIHTPAAREWCRHSCPNTHVKHATVGSYVSRAAHSGLYVRCD